MTPYHPLTDTGTPPEDAAMIWPWPHNWASPVTRRPEWSTVVMTSATGAEQRQALREYPREQVTYEHLLEGADSAMAFALLREWKGRAWLVPDWTEATKTTAPAGAVLSLGRYSVPAGLALLGTEVVTLLDAEGTLEVAPSGSWPAGTTLVPLRPASLDADQTVSHVTGTVSRISPTFLFEDVRPVDETVLTRITQPDRVSTTGAFTLVPGAFGHGVRSAGLSLSVGGTLGGSNVGTLEFWINADTSPPWQSAVLSFSASAYVSLTSGPVVGFYGIFTNMDLNLPSTGVWHHCAVSCDGAITRAFLNGSQVGSSNTVTHSAVTFSLVNLFGYLSNHDTLPGALDEVRFTQACRYTSDFTPAPCVVGGGDPYWSDVAFLMNGEVSRWGVDPSGAPTQDARAHMLPRAHNFSSPGSTQVSRELDELDPGVGLRHTRPRHDISTSQWSYDALLESDLDIWAFRALLQQHRGSAIGLYASPPGEDLQVSQIVDGLVSVPGSQFWSSAPPALDLLTPRGWECRKVASVGPAGVLLQNTGVQALPGEVISARTVNRVRVLGDAVEIRYHSLGVAEVSLSVASTPGAEGVGGGGGGGAIGGPWTEVPLPPVTPPTPVGQVILLVRGGSWPIVDESAVPRAISTEGSVDVGTSPALFGSTAAIRHLFFSFGAGTPQIHANSGSTVTAAGDWCAEVFARRNYASPTSLMRLFEFDNVMLAARNSDASVRISIGGATVAEVAGVFGTGEWAHLVWSRKDGVISVYVNGTRVLQYNYSNSFDMTNLTIGRTSGQAETIVAYLKYIRVTLGDSVYSGTSFPPLTSGY